MIGEQPSWCLLVPNSNHNRVLNKGTQLQKVMNLTKRFSLYSPVTLAALVPLVFFLVSFVGRMLTISTVFTSLVALYALSASPGQGQVEANVLRRGNTGHSSRQSHVIRGLLNVAGRDESFQRRQSGCDVGFFACADGTGCCPNGQRCDSLPDGTPTCCCTTGGNCPTGQLPCSANVNVCCPNGNLCSSTGSCSPAGSGGGGGGGTGGGGGGTGGGSGGSGSSTGAPKTTVSVIPPSSPALGGLGGTTTSPLVVSTPVVVTVTPTASSGTGLKSGEAGLRAGTAVVMMGSVIVASGLALLIL
ncbi:hypothetical protein JOM56_005263 [Amanita muscaria]